MAETELQELVKESSLWRVKEQIYPYLDYYRGGELMDYSFEDPHFYQYDINSVEDSYAEALLAVPESRIAADGSEHDDEVKDKLVVIIKDLIQEELSNDPESFFKHPSFAGYLAEKLYGTESDEETVHKIKPYAYGENAEKFAKGFILGMQFDDMAVQYTRVINMFEFIRKNNL